MASPEADVASGDVALHIANDKVLPSPPPLAADVNLSPAGAAVGLSPAGGPLLARLTSR